MLHILSFKNVNPVTVKSKHKLLLTFLFDDSLHKITVIFTIFSFWWAFSWNYCRWWSFLHVLRCIQVFVELAFWTSAWLRLRLHIFAQSVVHFYKFKALVGSVLLKGYYNKHCPYVSVYLFVFPVFYLLILKPIPKALETLTNHSESHYLQLETTWSCGETFPGGSRPPKLF